MIGNRENFEQVVLDRILVVNGWSAPTRYSMAFGIFVLSLGLRLGLFPVASGLPFLTFYPGLILSLLLCGTGPGILVTALSALAAYYFFFPPYRSYGYNAEALLA